MDLKDRIVVVTGGAGLLGKEFCRAIAGHNGTVVIADIDENSANKVSEDLRSLPGNIMAIGTDINNPASVANLIDTLDRKFGRIDALVNNAYPRNKNYGRKLFEVGYEDFCKNISLNLGGYFLVSQKFAEYFLKQGFGNIINIASVYGVIAPRFEIYEGTEMTMPVEYAFIKSGIVHFTRYLSKYLKGKNIRVNAISPGGVLNGQPGSFLDSYKDKCLNKGMLDASDLSGTLIYLLSDSSQYVNGQNIIVDDGFTL